MAVALVAILAPFSPGTAQVEGVVPPADMPDPERWRFIPASRMPEGNFFERLFITTFIVPIFSFESDVGAGGGVGFFDHDFRHQGRIERLMFGAEYTTEGQQTYQVGWSRLLNHRRIPEGVFHEERNKVFGLVRYRKPLTLRYFGRGDDTLEGAESSFSDERVNVEFGLIRSLPHATSDLVFDVRLRYERHRLGKGFASDVPTTRTAFPAEFAASPATGAFRVELGVTYDKRDSFANPYKGIKLNAAADLQPFESDGIRTDRFTVGASWATTVPPLLHKNGTPTEWNPPRDVIAIGAGLQWIAGDSPIYALPSLGGSRGGADRRMDLLRGYIAGRWRDRSAAFVSIEYRPVLLQRGFPIHFPRGVRVERLGLVLFADYGAVADEVEDLEDADWKFTPGVGLRFQFERDALLRLDVGFSDEGSNFSLSFGQAF